MLVAINSQDRSRTDTVDFDELRPLYDDGAQPTNLAGEHWAFAQRMIDREGNHYMVVYGFSEAEATASGEDASALPFDADHVVRCYRNEEIA